MCRIHLLDLWSYTTTKSCIDFRGHEQWVCLNGGANFTRKAERSTVIVNVDF